MDQKLKDSTTTGVLPSDLEPPTKPRKYDKEEEEEEEVKEQGQSRRT